MLSFKCLVALVGVVAAVDPTQLVFGNRGAASASAAAAFPTVQSVDGSVHSLIKHSDYPQYSLRVNTNDNIGLCDTTVKSYSGYLDISSDKSLFFWMFESRSNPVKDPLALWYAYSSRRVNPILHRSLAVQLQAQRR